MSINSKSKLIILLLLPIFLFSFPIIRTQAEVSGGPEGPPTSCFPPGTDVTLANGSVRDIEDIQVGDKVLSYNVTSGDYVNSTVLELESPIRERYYRLDLEEGYLNLTNEHPVYSLDMDKMDMDKGRYQGWASINPAMTKYDSRMDVNKLQKGDYVLNQKGKWERIQDTKKVDRETKTYNLKQVSHTNTFFANGILVHNKDDGSCGDTCCHPGCVQDEMCTVCATSGEYCSGCTGISNCGYSEKCADSDGDGGGGSGGSSCDQCPYSGATDCQGTLGRKCGDDDNDGCLEWSGWESCAPYCFSCGDGTCNSNCGETKDGCPQDCNSRPRAVNLEIEPGAKHALATNQLGFNWDFQDSDSSDYQHQFKLEVENSDSGQLVWETGNTSQEKEVVYQGPNFAPGTDYLFRVKVNDSYEWSPWNTSRFHTSSGNLTVDLVVNNYSVTEHSLRAKVHATCQFPHGCPQVNASLSLPGEINHSGNLSKDCSDLEKNEKHLAPRAGLHTNFCNFLNSQLN